MNLKNTEGDLNCRMCDTEAKILAAAEKVFFESGFSGARTIKIAEEAGVTHAMLHYYFGTKEKLFEIVIERKLGMLADIVLRAFSNSDESLEAMIRRGVEEHFDFISSSPMLPRFLLNEFYTNPSRLDIIKKIIAPRIADSLDDLQRKIDDEARVGRCRRVDARMLIMDMVSLNIFPVIAYPMATMIMGPESLIGEARKRENVDTILKKLNIQ